MANSKRIEWVDAAKGIGILLVIFGHTWLDWRYYNWCYAFHMPLFFVLSGITFSDKREPLEFVLHKMKTLLIPYVFFVVYTIVIRGSLCLKCGQPYDVLANAKAFLLQQRASALWFLTTLFLAEIVVYCLSKARLLRNLKMGGVILLLLISLHVFSVLTGNVNFVWNADLVPLASAFIIVGVFYKRLQQRIAFEKKSVSKWVVLLVFLMLSTANFAIAGRVNIHDNKYACLPLLYLAALAGVYAVILLMKSAKAPRWLLFLGVNSLLYYGLHSRIIEQFPVIWGKLGVNVDNTSLLSVVLAVISAVITMLILTPVVNFINKRCPWIIGKF